MSYGNTFQNRLGLNFDVTKFGLAIDPFGDLDERLGRQSSIIRNNTATVYTAIANSAVSVSTYYKNPLSTVISSLTNVISVVYSTIWNYGIDDGDGGINYILRPIASQLPTTFAGLTQELAVDDTNTDGTPKGFNTFISHTQRLSNLKASNRSNRPSFSSAQSVLQTVQTLIYQTETTSTAVVGALGLGAFTSLFIESDLVGYWTNLTGNLNAINALVALNPATVSPSLSATISVTNANFSNLLNLLTTRRSHDETFYQNALAINQDLGKVSANKNAASTSSAVSSYLVDNLIGTDALKNL